MNNLIKKYPTQEEMKQSGVTMYEAKKQAKDVYYVVYIDHRHNYCNQAPSWAMWQHEDFEIIGEVQTQEEADALQIEYIKKGYSGNENISGARDEHGRIIFKY